MLLFVLMITAHIIEHCIMIFYVLMFTARILNKQSVLWFVLHVSGQYWPFAFISNK